MKIDRMLDQYYAANLLALQGALRLGGLLGLGILGSVRKTLDTYLICMRHGAGVWTPPTDPPGKLVAGCMDAMTECVEKSWQDYRNNLQILLLIQDEALIWVARIDRALAAN